ncbi:hypothetical protein O7627_36975 [Solwaraspora sp. WMMD1047]|uniref:hypothetical protein n=1 Tax=Solwaraspora sp. WMMD1047 TaxID=3016102 RepID=UPI002417E206|nr:hypothetical protein [Solwaraspora sp. WMMD1047]MDG4834865.1 hypothetical protein [Solwaraspora sp. WMMD1047]
MTRTPSPRVTRTNLILGGLVPPLFCLPGVALLAAGPTDLAPAPIGAIGTAVVTLLWLAAALLIPIPGLINPGHSTLLVLLIHSTVSIIWIADAVRRTPASEHRQPLGRPRPPGPSRSRREFNLIT